MKLCLILYYFFIKKLDEDDEDDVEGHIRDEVANTIKALNSKLEDLKTCDDLIVKHGAALQKSLADIEALDTSSPDLPGRTKTVNERATLFRISSNAMINVSTIYTHI